MDKSFQKYIGLPIQDVQKEFEEKNYKVNIIKNSKMKIESDYELVVNINVVNDNEVNIVTGEFLINIEKIQK